MDIKKLNQDKLLTLEKKKKDHEIALAEQKNYQEKEEQNLKLRLENERKDI